MRGTYADRKQAVRPILSLMERMHSGQRENQSICFHRSTVVCTRHFNRLEQRTNMGFCRASECGRRNVTWEGDAHLATRLTNHAKQLYYLPQRSLRQRL